MNKLVFILTLCFVSVGTFAMPDPRNLGYKSSRYSCDNDLWLIGQDKSELPIYQTCLQTALSGINQAYANFDNNISFCAEIHTTGPGFLDCARFARRIREYQVAMVYTNFNNCTDYPSI